MFSSCPHSRHSAEMPLQAPVEFVHLHAGALAQRVVRLAELLPAGGSEGGFRETHARDDIGRLQEFGDARQATTLVLEVDELVLPGRVSEALGQPPIGEHVTRDVGVADLELFLFSFEELSRSRVVEAFQQLRVGLGGVRSPEPAIRCRPGERGCTSPRER